MKLFVFWMMIAFFNLAAFAQGLTNEVKKASIENISKMLKENYVFEDVAVKCGEHLNKKYEEGTFKDVNDPKAFSELLTKELQSISKDKHMRVRPRPQAQNKNEAPNPLLDNYLGLKDIQSKNYGVAKVERLEGNVGYLDLRFFPDISMVKKHFSAAMRLLEGSDAIIVDLRKNSGGSPSSIKYICSYLFDKPTHLNSLYYRKENKTEEFWTSNDIDGSKMSDVPVYVLTSNFTFSGGEEFANNIKTQKRGLIIGEVTGGGANPGGMFPVNEQIAIFIPTGRAINPVTNSNWEGVGVIPDIETKADDAFNVAYDKAKAAAKEYNTAKISEFKKKADNFAASLNPVIKSLAQSEDKNAEKELNKILDEAVQSGMMDEPAINQLGYQFMFENNINMAIALFKYNVAKYPESWNVYDSLGEAYLQKGDKAAAKENYQKSLKINPDNKHGEEVLKTLK